MAFEAANPRLFGLDLSRLASGFRQGLEGMLRWPALAWLSPAQPVHVMWPDGAAHVCTGTSFDVLPDVRHADFRALVLPAEITLSHAVRLPPLASADVAAALELQLQSLSPLPVEQIVWGWRVDTVLDDVLEITVAFAPRAHVQAYLERLGVVGQEAALEVWVDAAGPVVMNGFGEGLRAQARRSQRRGVLALVALAVALAMLLSVAHFWQLRSRVFDAQEQFAAMQTRAAPFVAARDSLMRANDRVQAIGTYIGARPDVPRLLLTLTELLPDNAWLARMDVEGRKVRITGQSGDAAGLMEALRAHPQFSQIRALSPISRGRDGLDSFNFEFMVLPPGAAQ